MHIPYIHLCCFESHKQYLNITEQTQNSRKKKKKNRKDISLVLSMFYYMSAGTDRGEGTFMVKTSHLVFNISLLEYRWFKVIY